MTELEIEELERKVTGTDSVIVGEARIVGALPDQLGEDVKMFCWKWKQKSRLMV